MAVSRTMAGVTSMRIGEGKGENDAHDEGQSRQDADQKSDDDSHDEKDQVDRLETIQETDCRDGQEYPT